MAQTGLQSVDGSDQDSWSAVGARPDEAILLLLEIASKTLKAELTPQDDLLARGLSVNRALRIVADYWRATGTEMDVNIFFRRRSIAGIAAAIEANDAYSEGKIVPLRDGDRERPLFCYAGGANCFLEMRDVIAALAFPGAIHGIAVTARPFHPDAPPTVEKEARDALAAVRRIQPRGPYRLLGFSFGGVLALELARVLEGEGETVEFLGMLDSPLGDRGISWLQWSKLMSRVVSRQIISRLFALGRHGMSRAHANVFPGLDGSSRARKGHRILLRFLSPLRLDYPLYNPQWVNGFPPRYSAMGAQIMRMKGLYRPRPHRGKICFFSSRGGSPIDCPSREVWAPYLGDAEWIEANGTHLSMLVGRNGKALAADIDERLRR